MRHRYLILAALALGACGGAPGARAIPVQQPAFDASILMGPVFEQQQQTTTVPEASWPEVAVVDAPAQRGAQVQIIEPEGPPWEGAWPHSIPEYYGAGSGCTREEAEMTAWQMRGEGATDDTIRWMLKTYSKETTCDHTAHRLDNDSRDDSWGVCQLNRRSGHFSEGGILEGYDYTRFAGDFLYNVEACTALWKVCGRGPWTKPYWCSTPEELR